MHPTRLTHARSPNVAISTRASEHSVGVTVPYIATGAAGSTAAPADFAAYLPPSAASFGVQAASDILNYEELTPAAYASAVPIGSVSGGATALHDDSALAFATARSASRSPDRGDGIQLPATGSAAAVRPSPKTFNTSNDTATFAALPAVVDGATAVGMPILAAAASTSASDTSALETSGNFAINLEFDAAALAAPSSFRTGMEQAASLLAAAISVASPITINIQIQYNENGIAAGSAYSGPSGGEYVAYSTVRSDLIANAAPGDTNFDALPTGSTIQGQSDVAVWDAQLKALGILSGTDTGLDGLANFSSSINSNALVGVALHELTHAMGRVPYGPPDGASPDIFDMFRFTSPGTILIEDQIPATAAYFSVDGGATALADYGVNSDPSDFLNSSTLTPNDAFNEFYSPGQTFQTLTAVDLTQIDVLGFNTNIPTSRTFDWTGASNSDFGNALNWDDVTDGINPAATPPGATDLAFVNNGGAITGTGTVSALSFSGTNTVAGSLAAINSLTDSGGILSVSGALIAASMSVASGAILSVGAGGSLDPGSPLIVDGTLSTAGTINGGGTTEVSFGSGTDRLILGPDATFGGTVVGGGVDSTLELAAGADAGTLNALGTNFTNFGTVTVDAGAIWTVDAATSLLPSTTFIGDGASSMLMLSGAGTFSLAGVSNFGTIDLAAGNDTVTVTDTTLSGGAVTISDGASGNNTVSAEGDTSASTGETLTYNAGTGTDSFTGGFENDTINLSAAAVGGDVLTGGSGTNTLTLTSAGSTNLGGVSRLGTINLASGNSTVTVKDTTLAGGTLTVDDGASGNNSVSVAGDTSASAGKTLTYNAGTGTDRFAGGFENDTINVSAAAVGGDVLTGGSGTNTLTLTSAGTANLAGVSTFGTIDLAAGNNTVTVTDKTLSGATVTINDGASGNNTVSAASDTSASKGKTLAYDTGASTDSFTGGFENDTVAVSIAALGSDTLTGGSGTNTLVLTSAGVLNLSGAGKFRTIDLAAGNSTVTVTDSLLSAGSLTINDGASGNNAVSAASDTSASTGKTLTYNAGPGTDSFTGGFENDAVHVSAAAVGGDMLTGGSGVNILTLTSAGAVSLGGVSKFGTINLAAVNSTVTMTDTTLSGGTVKLNDGASGNNTVSLAGDTSASKGKILNYFTGSGTDSFTGGFENDTVHVSAAAVGGDVLTGGSGANNLILTSAGTVNLGGVSKFGTINLAAGNNTVTLTATTLSGGTVVLEDGASGNNTVSAAGDTSASKGRILNYFTGSGTGSFTGGFENDTVHVSAAAVGGDVLTGGSGTNNLIMTSAGTANFGGVSKFGTINLAAGNNMVTLADTTLSGGTVLLNDGASGNDTVTAAGDTSASKGKALNYFTGPGTDSFTGGFENDTVHVSAAASGGDVLTGGSATNTLVLTSAGTVNLAGISKFGTVNLAAGNNTVTVTDTTLSGGAATINDGASGNNTISAAGDTSASAGKTLTYKAGKGADSFTGNFENDTVNVSAAAVGGDVLTGGSGVNILDLATAGSVNLGGVSKFGTINLAALSNTVTITDTTLSGGTVKLNDGASGNDTVSLAGDTLASTGKILNYFTGSGTDNFTGWFENDTVHVLAALVGGDVLTAGSGANNLILTSAGTVNLARVRNFRTINLAAGNSTVTLADTTLSGGTVVLEDGASGNNTVSAAGDTSTSKGRILNYFTGPGTDSFTGGFENDTVHVSAAAAGGNVLTGGSGTNNLIMSSAGTANLGGVSKFGTINLAAGNNTVTLADTTLSGGTVLLNDGASGNDTVTASGDTSASKGKVLNYFTGPGTDSFTGGFENATVHVSAAAVGGDVFTGGSGTNTLVLTSAGTVNLGGVSKFSTINLAAGTNTATVTDTTLSGGSVTIKAGSTGSDTISAAGDTAASKGTSLTYNAGSGTNGFIGGFENDTIYAGTGSGSFTAGSGSDTFVFIKSNLPNQTLNNFQVSADDILVYGTHASGGFNLGSTDNPLNPTTPTAIDPSIFVVNVSGDFTSSTQRFAYDTTNGQLHYSATGSDASESLIATLTGEPNITAGNLLFER